MCFSSRHYHWIVVWMYSARVSMIYTDMVTLGATPDGAGTGVPDVPYTTAGSNVNRNSDGCKIPSFVIKPGPPACSDGKRKRNVCKTRNSKEADHSPKRKKQVYMDSFVHSPGISSLNADAPALGRKRANEFYDYMVSKYPMLCLASLPRAWFSVIFDQNSGEDGGEERFNSDATARAIHEALQTESRLICPQPLENMWKWARSVPDPNRVHVVVTGQDPYHSVWRHDNDAGTTTTTTTKTTRKNSVDDKKSGNRTAVRNGPITMADGLAFSVNPEYARLGKSLPPTLTNIMKLADSSFERRIHDETRFRGDLTIWTEAGVLLLNAALTTVENTANAHADIGWHTVTDRVIEWLGKKSANKYTSTRIFMLWGSDAKQKRDLIDSSAHVIMTSCHPSPLSAYKNGWFDRDVFKEANLILRTLGHAPVNWSCRRYLESDITNRKSRCAKIESGVAAIGDAAAKSYALSSDSKTAVSHDDDGSDSDDSVSSEHDKPRDDVNDDKPFSSCKDNSHETVSYWIKQPKFI